MDFAGFSLSQVHVEDGELPVWEDRSRHGGLLAMLVGVAVRDRWPDAFFGVHMALFRARHDEARDISDEGVLRDIVEAQGLDPDAVLSNVDDGWPLKVLREEHESWVRRHHAFGVPTFVVGDHAAFVRVMTRPHDDPGASRGTIDRILGLVEEHPELNEVKHTSLSR